MNVLKLICISILLHLSCFFIGESVMAGQLKADAIIQEDAVYVGEPFAFQVRITGDDQPEQPDLSILNGFHVEYQGGSQNNSSSITIINGKMTRNISRGYVFSYQLTPKQTGTLTIPPINIKTDAETLQTRPVHINVFKPEQTDDVKLRIFLSKDSCYEGEPLTFTVKWFLRQDVRSFNFMIPLLEKTDWFHFIDPQVDQKSSKKYYRIPLADGEVIAEQGQDSFEGITYSTIAFSKILIPKKSGILTIDPATVSCEILTGYRQSRNRNAFFSGVFGGRQGIYKKVIASSNNLRLTVHDVPARGKPANYAGHIGEYTIQADATPIEVSIGDPITLTLSLTGPDYLEHVTLPSLTNQGNLAKDFKIPSDRATGEIQGKTKVFTQTIRALRSDINQIPAVELPYFDTATGKYKIARTVPIPINVKETRVITALDAEGRALPVANGSEVETWTKGIAFNYEDINALTNQQVGLLIFKSSIWKASLVLPPLLYLMVLLISTFIRKKQADPQSARAKKAYARLKSDLKKYGNAESEQFKMDKILNALRRYLGARLQISGQAIVFNDVRCVLSEKGVSEKTLAGLKSVFDMCESTRYSGTPTLTGDVDHITLIEKILSITKKLEAVFK
ncbi:MAG: BatD family protein [Desulfobacteraceae bacterium]|nr:BatD family protein [Desulfobacteraceae bacterium]